jgi:hypothetical protein
MDEPILAREEYEIIQLLKSAVSSSRAVEADEVRFQVLTAVSISLRVTSKKLTDVSEGLTILHDAISQKALIFQDGLGRWDRAFESHQRQGPYLFVLYLTTLFSDSDYVASNEGVISEL